MQRPPSYVSRGLSIILALNSLVLPIRMVDVWFAPLRGLCPNGKISNYPGSFYQCTTFEISDRFYNYAARSSAFLISESSFSGS